MTLVTTSGADRRIVAGRSTPAGVLRAVLIGVAVAAIFAPAAALHWTETLPEGRVASILTVVAGDWDDALSAAGASGPYAWLRHAVRAFQAMRF
jgi:hypothetical protein